MATSDPQRKELADLELKLAGARRAAAAPDASEREVSDLKLIEQEYLAAQQKARHASPERKPAPDTLKEKVDRKLDAALKDSFPGSDPVSFVEAAPEKKDRTLPEVEAKTSPKKTP
ncbi:MAG: hypothetical protein KIT25_09670 [Enhydrobacter sp.]|nr:MAG: hypothetical protein KIT25_09670 [Enhydrobacter sp.]